MRKLLIPLVSILVLLGCAKDSPEEEIIPEIFELRIIATANSAAEPGVNGEFKVSLTKPVEVSLKITFTVEGTAESGKDYRAIPNTVTILANRTNAIIPVLVLDDFDSEEIETVSITLTGVDDERITLGTQIKASVNIEDEIEEFTALHIETAKFMANPNASAETIALFYNLKEISKTSFIVGQQDAFSKFYSNNSGNSDVMRTTGSDPGLLGSDFMFITDDMNDGAPSNWFYQQEQSIKNDALNAYDKGMVNVFAWHLREPYEGISFYTGEMTDFQKQNALISILPGGENHGYYKQKLEKVSEVAQSMIGFNGQPIPIIFRPFHEFDGDWFWWGANYCSPDQFKELWRFTFDYLINVLKVNNMLFAFSPDRLFNSEAEYLERYPGDAYVDILGTDNYGDFETQNQVSSNAVNGKLQIVSNLAKEKNKIAALTETCYFVRPGETEPMPGFYSENLYTAMTSNDVEISFMMFWSNSNEEYCTPTPDQPSVEDFMQFINKPESLLANELPRMYTIDVDL